MLLEAGILGGLSATGFLLTFSRLPKKLKKLVTDHPLITDIAATAATYKLLGMTLTALTAAGFMSVLISVGLFVPGLRRKILGRFRKVRKKDKTKAERNMIFPKMITLNK